ncbi:ead/Ea22-like family protein [Ewingella americana]|uniref:ead/Ea22-like family protein n=1 Tax=Ewingella americana TaxID=41202 RepID=UPI00163AA225|nr:ead/Ea22-like family protein [Ewingella americana]QMV54111.1 hypothetical protein GXP68_22900 [Ewingella americana]
MTEKTDIAALREAALMATAGEWCTDSQHSVIADAGLNANYYVAACSGPDSQINASFISLANPATIIALLDQLEAERHQREAAEAELAELRGEQEPVAWIKCGEVTTEPTTADVWIREMNEGYGYDVEVLCKRQPKPVVVMKSGYLHKSEVIKAIEDAGIVVRFETAGIVAKDGE